MAVACGSNGDGQRNLPTLEAGETYTQVAAGGGHTVLLKDNGQAVACGSNDDGECNIPDLAAGERYTQIATGFCHTVLLKDNGQAVACGANLDGECNIPALAAGETYTQIAAGGSHTVCLKNNGQVVACGCNDHGQCNIPALAAGETYKQISAGVDHTVLLKELPKRILNLTSNMAIKRNSAGEEHFAVSCVGLDGAERCCVQCCVTNSIGDLHRIVMRELDVDYGSLWHLVFPNGQVSSVADQSYARSAFHVV